MYWNKRSVFFALLLPLSPLSLAMQETPVVTDFGTFTMNGELPRRSDIATLQKHLDTQQATQAYLWALPLVSFAQWQAEQCGALGVPNGDMVLYDSYRDKLGILTPNGTTPYVIGFVDLSKTGPMVMDMPAGATAGGVNDAWQREIAVMGEASADKGNGGKYLLIPPGGKVPDVQGYHIIQSTTMNVMVGFRALDADPTKAAALMDAFKLYPYNAGVSAAGKLVRLKGEKPWYGGQPAGLAYWQRLHAIIQTEPVEERDRLFMAMLRQVGIEKGKPFHPTAEQVAILTMAASTGELLAKTNAFAKRFENSRVWPDKMWDDVLVLNDPSQRTANYDELNERASWFYEAVTISKSMMVRSPGIGQAYLGAYTDGKGEWLDGGKPYRLRVSAKVPAKDFWSVTAYDVKNRSFVINSQQSADRSSRMNLKKNADGTIDIYFGPEKPKGADTNWIETVPGRQWFAYFRLYGPTEAYFNKSWKLDDIEQVQ